jgi:hypothetical protein
MKRYRGERTVGPRIRPVYTYALVLISFMATLGIQGFRYERVWTPLERHYFLDYSYSQIVGVMRDNGWYTLLEVVTRKGSRLALDSDVAPAVTASGENTFALRKEALKHGSLRLESYRSHYNNAEMHAYLGSMIYRNRSPMDLVRAALWSGLGLFFAGLLPATYLDQRRIFALRYGTKLRGPELMTVGQFNRPHLSRGMGFVNKHRTMLDRILGLNKKLPVPLAKHNPQVLLTAEPLPQEPLKMAAAAAGTDKRPQASGTQQESAPPEQAPSQDQKFEHAVAPTERRFFE